MKSSTQSRTSSKPSSKQSSTQKGGPAPLQCKLTFGNTGQLGVKKIEQKADDSKPQIVKSQFNSKKRTAQEIVNGDTVEVEIIESPVSAKRQKLSDGSSEAKGSKLPQIEEESKVEEMEVETHENKPPKDIEKLRSPSHPQYDPIIDAPMYKGQPMPFSLIARALAEIEACKGQHSKDTVKEMIGNIFRSAILLVPQDLSDLFYFFIVKLSPDYEGLETGVGHEMVLKSVAKACGKSPAQIRDAFKKEGDLGIVVQQGKSS